MHEYLLNKILEAKPGNTIQDEDGKMYKVLLARNGCRFVSLGKDIILMEQNILKDPRFARMVRDGARIGWVIPKKGRWKLVRAGSEKPDS